jgi:hypothetical protein
MTSPIWLADGLAVVMLVVSAYCAGRLVVARRLQRVTNYSVDAVHTAMGVAMAAVLTGHLGATTTWTVVFVAAAAWFGLRAASGLLGRPASSPSVGSHLRHLLTSATMIYMLLASPAAAAASTAGTANATTMGASAAVRFPTLALLLGLFMVGYTVMVMDRLSRASSEPHRDGLPPVLAPRTVACCQVAMNLTMGYMLVVML